MAATLKKYKSKIEAYFAEQDLDAIIPELHFKHLISNAEAHEINSTEIDKRAHTLTKILESKIVNNPDLFMSLKQVLSRSFKFDEDFPQPGLESSLISMPTITVTSPSGKPMPPTESSQKTPVLPTWSSFRESSSGDAGYSLISRAHLVSPTVLTSTHQTDVPAMVQLSQLSNSSLFARQLSESSASSGYSSLHSVNIRTEQSITEQTQLSQLSR